MKTLLIAAACLALVAPAVAREGASESPAGAVPAASVQHADLDLSTDRGAGIMFRRLQRAVASVCDVPEIDRPSPALRREIDACKDAALSEAVATLDAPAVTRLHEAQAAAVSYQR